MSDPQSSYQALLEDNKRLCEELKQCKADKEFVWLLWKQLQQQSPDLTATVEMVVKREKLRNEERNKQLASTLHSKEEQLGTFKLLLNAKQEESVRKEMQLKKIQTQQSQDHGQVQDVLDNYKSLKQKCDELHRENQRLLNTGNDLRKQIGDLKLELKEKEHVSKLYQSQEVKIESLQREMNSLEDNFKKVSSECVCSLEQCRELEGRVRRREEELRTAEEVNREKELEIKQLSLDLKQAKSLSTNNTALQTNIQKLTADRRLLRAELSAKEEKLLSQAKALSHLSTELEEVQRKGQEASTECHGLRRELAHSSHTSCSSYGFYQREVRRLEGLLGKAEKEAFEVKARLQSKEEEVECLRGAHDRRLQRMEALQQEHRLVLKQIKTYEAHGSPTVKKAQKSLKAHRTTTTSMTTPPAKRLKQESSTGVWNQLALCKARCQELEKQLIVAQEENDAVKAKYFKSQSTVQELRGCLMEEKAKLESKLSALMDLESQLSTTNLHDQKLKTKCAELERLVSQLQQEKADVTTQYTDAKSECYGVRQEAAHLQKTVMQLRHKQQLKRLSTLCKSTMTDSLLHATCTSTALRPPHATDSSTQVDASSSPLIKRRPVELRDAQLSPILFPGGTNKKLTVTCPSCGYSSTGGWEDSSVSDRLADSTDDLSSTCGSSVHPPTTTRRLRSSRTTAPVISGDLSLLHRKRANTALKRVQELSASLNETAAQPVVEPSPTSNKQPSVSLKNDCTCGDEQSGTTCTCTVALRDQAGGGGGANAAQRAKQRVVVVGGCGTCSSGASKHNRGRRCAGTHKCGWYQQNVVLQQRIKTLTKQVGVLGVAKQALSQAVEAERKASEKARGECKRLNARQQDSKDTIESLQKDVQRLSDEKKALEQKCKILESMELQSMRAERKACRTETESRVLEEDRKRLQERCSTLSDTIKSLEAQALKKSEELGALQERCSVLERDVRQKRLLIEDQRGRLKEVKEDSTSTQNKLQSLTSEVATLNESSAKSKHQRESLHLQLKAQTSEKEKLASMLYKCQEELSHSIKQSVKYKEDSERKKQLLEHTRQSMGHRAGQAAQEHSQLAKELSAKIRSRDILLREFKRFTLILAEKLIGHLSIKLSKKDTKHHLEDGDSMLSTKAREIARDVLNLSDCELDEFLTDPDHLQKENSSETCEGFQERVEQLVDDEPPFAAELAEEFITYIKSFSPSSSR